MIYFILVILIVIFSVGYYISERLLRVQVNSIEKTYNDGVKNFPYVNEDEFKKLIPDKLEVISQYGYELNVDLYRTKEPSNNYIIFCHGVTDTKYGSVKYIEVLKNLGFNCLIYDHRRHGENKDKGKYTTYGIREKDDLHKIVERVKEKFKVDKLGLHGVSMGAATILLYGGFYNDVDFYIADCPFSKFNDQVAFRLKVENNLPRYPFIITGSIFTKIRGHFLMMEVSPLKAIQKIKNNVLLIQSKGDKYIPYKMTRQLYNAPSYKGKREIKLFDVGDHTESFLKNRDDYIETIANFIKNI